MELVTAADVERLLPFDQCIAVIHEAMLRFSQDKHPQPLRNVMPLGVGSAFGVMPGRLSGTGYFGAKVVSVFSTPSGHQRHQGFVLLFDGADGAPVRIADAEAITSIRTAAATAVATEALARPDAGRLAIFGCGLQAAAHLAALTAVRRYDEIMVWGRSPDRLRHFVRAQSEKLGLILHGIDDAETVARRADVICTVTSSPSPILLGRWVQKGAHVNLVGSSVPGPSEVDSALVAMARFFVDSRPSAEAQAAEYRIALEEGAIGPSHIAGEIGEVLAGIRPGRMGPDDVTVYKSLGLIVQDLAAIEHIHRRLQAEEQLGASTPAAAHTP